MLAIGIELLNQSYGACPWDTAHIEGIVEWPPSPWRIYRAIFAGFFSAKNTEIDIKQSEVESIISVLAQNLPSYYLPNSAYVQTRTVRKDKTDTLSLHKPGKKVISGELRFNPNDSTIYIYWDVELNESQKESLSICLEFCGYIGRRESDAVWRIENENHLKANCRQDLRGNLKTLVPGDDFEPKHLLKNPIEIFDIERRQSVPGAKWTSYVLDPLKQTPETEPDSRGFNYARVAMIANFPLRDRHTLYFSEKLHQTLVSKSPSSSNFTGCDRDKNYLRSNNHVYLIPVTEAGQIIAFDIYSHKGFTSSEERALIALKTLYFHKSTEVILKLVAMGKTVDYASPSLTWQSVTPMFLPRHPATLRGKPKMLKKSIYQKDGPEHQALKLLLHLPNFEVNKSKDVEYQPTGFGLEQWIDGELFCRSRARVFSKYWQWKSDRSRGTKAVSQGYWIELSFTRPQLAPIAIGYAAHFGLGVFAPCQGEMNLSNACGEKICSSIDSS